MKNKIIVYDENSFYREIVQESGYINRFFYKKSEDGASLRHRADGPAIYSLLNNEIIYQEWWLDGKHIDVASQKEFERFIKLKVFV